MEEKSMESDETNDVIRLLAYHWTKVEIQVGDMTYTTYMDAVTRLQAATKDLDRTMALLAAIVNQASQLGKSPEWVERELYFETQVTSEQRAEWLLVDIAAQSGSDDSLDRYNERLSRFFWPLNPEYLPI